MADDSRDIAFYSQEILAPVTIVNGDAIPLRLPHRARGALAWRLRMEDGTELAGRRGIRPAGDAPASLALPVPMGYHRLEITWRSKGHERQARTLLIVAPQACYQPFGAGALRWGAALDFRALRTARSWGIGDFTDLVNALRAAAGLGAACIAIDPHHPRDPRFLDPLVLDVEGIEDYQGNTLVREIVNAPAFQEKRTTLQAAEIDRDAIATLKEAALRPLQRAFHSSVLAVADAPRSRDFRAFQDANADALEHFQAHARDLDIAYQAYLQWQTDCQLKNAQAIARRLGLSIGIYIRLPGESGPGGMDDTRVLWLHALLQRHMRGAGALRIEPEKLARLLCISDDDRAKQEHGLGWPCLIAVLALESHRHRCAVAVEGWVSLPLRLQEILHDAGAVRVETTECAATSEAPLVIVPLQSLARLEQIAPALAQRRADFLPGLGARPAVAHERKTPPAVPLATYRLQFNEGFSLDDAARVIPYLHALGVSHLYGSPWLKARKGSTHGYDVTDYGMVNPELGGSDALNHLACLQRTYGMGHVLDFVPNHMGIGGANNMWWQDVLENGRTSPFAAFFDIEWNPGYVHLRNRILLPLLGAHYGHELEAGHITLRFDQFNGAFNAWYYRTRLPIRLADYGALLRLAAAALPKRQRAVLLDLAQSFDALPTVRPRARSAAKERLQARLAATAYADGDIAAAIEQAIAGMRGAPGYSESLQPFHALLERQNYHLAHWATGSDEINYRRFFNINELAAVRMELPSLFGRAHRLVTELLASGVIHGLRIDHVDGLFDPLGYCQRLQQPGPPSAARPYVVVEKILARHERLRGDWPVAGTTGYDFVAQVGALLVNGGGEELLSRAYARFAGANADFEQVLAACKAQVLDTMFRSELIVLARRLHRIALAHWDSRDYTQEGLRQALRAIAVHFPVYRTYVGAEIDADDRRDIDWAVARARKAWLGAGVEALDFVAGVLTGDLARDSERRYPAAAVIRFARQFQQFTAPIMAKSVEDTAFYRYHRLISLNEVGSDPRQFSLSAAAFHHASRERAKNWPHGLLATATHDTKRGEDARARIHALADVAAEWTRQVRAWAEVNRRHKAMVDDAPAPDSNDEYLLYQTLVGTWPPALNGDPSQTAAFAERIKVYMTKCMREAKFHSSWDAPNAPYETATFAFVDRILDAKFGRAFLRHFRRFEQRVAQLGVLNSLSQVTLKLCAPGVPDLYQGTELWDFHLVDPDNRAPVDFSLRARLVAELRAENPANLAARVAEWRDCWQDGRIKLHVVLRLLALRASLPDLFSVGAYEPLDVTGPEADRVVAFVRRDHGHLVAVAVARHLAALLEPGRSLPRPEAWGSTALPPISGLEARGDGFSDVLTGRRTALALGATAADLFAVLPVAVVAA